MSRWRVIEAHEASYTEPIAFDVGDEVRLTGHEDIWDGHRWLWASAPNGREGWIPDSFANAESRFVAKSAYSAMELTCRVGEVLEGDAETHGWVWARNSHGNAGWAPLRNLAPISDQPRQGGDPN